MFGGKEGKEAQGPFPFKTRATQVLFVQYVMQILEPGGKCGIVLDEGLLYRTNEDGFIRTKRKLLDECDLWCILSLPGGANHPRPRMDRASSCSGTARPRCQRAFSRAKAKGKRGARS